MQQHRTRPEAAREIPAVADEPPRPIERRTIETEFFDALESGSADEGDTSGPHAGPTAAANRARSVAESTSSPSGLRPQPIHAKDLSPARRLAAPMFIATCVVLGLLTHGAGANRLLSLLPQTETPPPRAEAAPLFSNAWRQISRFRDSTAGRDAIAVNPPAHEAVVSEPRVREGTAGETAPAAKPEEPFATPPIDTDPGNALFVPIAIDAICAIPIVFDLSRTEPEAVTAPTTPLLSLTELYPYEPWSMRPADAGPVGRAQAVVQAVRAAQLRAAEAIAPVPVAAQPKTVVKAKPESRPATARVRAAPPASPTPAEPGTKTWSQDAFRF